MLFQKNKILKINLEKNNIIIFYLGKNFFWFRVYNLINYSLMSQFYFKLSNIEWNQNFKMNKKLNKFFINKKSFLLKSGLNLNFIYYSLFYKNYYYNNNFTFLNLNLNIYKIFLYLNYYFLNCWKGNFSIIRVHGLGYRIRKKYSRRLNLNRTIFFDLGLEPLISVKIPSNIFYRCRRRRNRKLYLYSLKREELFNLVSLILVYRKYGPYRRKGIRIKSKVTGKFNFFKIKRLELKF